MSGVSHFTTKPLPPAFAGHDWRRHGNPPPTNYFKSREMNFNETMDSDNMHYYPDYYGEMTDNAYNDYGSYHDYVQTDPDEYSTYNYDYEQYPETTRALEAPQPSMPQSKNELDFHKGRTNPAPE